MAHRAVKEKKAENGTKFSIKQLGPTMQRFRGHLQKKLSPEGMRRYVLNVLKFEEYLKTSKGKSLEQMTAEDIAEYKEYLNDMDLTKNTIYNYILAVRRFSEFLWKKKQVDLGSPVANDNLPQLLQKYRAHLEKKLAPGTIRVYLLDLLKFEKFLKERDKRLDQMSKEDITEFEKWLQNSQKFSYNRVRNYILSVRRFAEFLWNDKLVRSKPGIPKTRFASPLLRKLEEEKMYGWSESTKRSYLYRLMDFEDFLKEKRHKGFDQLKRADVTAYLSHNERKGLKSRTIDFKLNCIRCLVEYLWEEDKLDDKEYRKIKGITVKLEKDNDEHRALSEEEVESCFKKLANPMLRMMFWAGLNYGLRLSEYTRLTLADIDLDGKYLTIRLSKGKKTRRVPILPDHIPEWQEWLRTRKSYKLNHDYVFFSSAGKLTTDVVRKYFSNARSGTGMSQIVFGDDRDNWFTSHTLRYTFATNRWKQGLNLKILSMFLGHSSIKTTELYLKINESEAQKMYEEWSENQGK
ncbi:MAG: site-specific integrase [Candidatus Hodarchaeales archaeon]|jgi:site-specific recombinase XerD